VLTVTFFFNFSARTTSVGRPEPTWCFYFISNAPFFFTFLLLRCARVLPGTVPASSRSLFDLHLHLILLHFYFLLFATSRASIWPVLFSISSLFELRFVWSCALILALPFSFAFTDIVIVLSICLCFVVLVEFVWPIWVCLCCWFWRGHCGFGFGITTALQEVCFYVLWNGRTICVRMFIYIIRMLVQIRMFWENVWCMFLENV